ncbi:MAG: hypothetical protein H7A40_01995 [Chlamydiales bacterium]|nr:hypothetical protein [Chlamydiales bacterium]
MKNCWREQKNLVCREGEKEVDFVLKHGKTVVAIEVKRSAKRQKLSGMYALKKAFRGC